LLIRKESACVSESKTGVTLALCEDLSLATMLLRRGHRAVASQAFRDGWNADLPSPGGCVKAGAALVLWDGPDRFTVVQDGRGNIPEAFGQMFRDMAYVIELSDARTVFQLSADGAAEALSRIIPIDLHPRAFGAGSVAQTVAGHISVQLWRPGEEPLFRIACASSFGASLLHLLDSIRA
jgi:sarcosine oxidase subunit gamma